MYNTLFEIYGFVKTVVNQGILYNTSIQIAVVSRRTVHKHKAVIILTDAILNICDIMNTEYIVHVKSPVIFQTG